MNILEILPLDKPIKAEVAIPGSKSYTNRALILGALTENAVKIVNPLFCDDTTALINCLKTLGIKIKQTDTMIEVIGSVKDIQNKNYDLNADLSGTTMRFILALSTIIPGVKIISGQESRPIGDLVNGLRQLGAKIAYLDKEGYPPLRVTSAKLSSGTIQLNGNISSQYLSALLMIAPLVGNIVIKINNKLISKPYIDMTIE
ncbi:MAG TPA: 3-phosphoshikimate 1-carboxyvinyltransferase, partial [Patescibacteria group bacterium]